MKDCRAYQYTGEDFPLPIKAFLKLRHPQLNLTSITFPNLVK